MDWLALDQELFYFIHRELASPFLDTVLPVWREKITWVPAYLAAATALIYYHRRSGLYLLALIGLAILLADQLTSSVIKPLVGRPRPCYAAEFAGQIRELVGCGGHDSFPSSHASNHFALAVLLCLTWLRNRRAWQWTVLIWAATICFAQVYVAKHYPLDVLVGGILGTGIAVGLVILWRHFGKRPLPGDVDDKEGREVMA